MEQLVADTVEFIERESKLGVHVLSWANALSVVAQTMRFAGRYSSLTGAEKKQVVASAMRIVADRHAVGEGNTVLHLVCDNLPAIIDQLHSLHPEAYAAACWKKRLTCCR